MAIKTVEGIIHLKRLHNSINGNPAFSVAIGNHKGRTKPDSGWVYAISDSWNGRKGVATFEDKYCTDLTLLAN